MAITRIIYRIIIEREYIGEYLFSQFNDKAVNLVIRLSSVTKIMYLAIALAVHLVCSIEHQVDQTP